VKHLSRRSYAIHFTGSIQLDRPLQPEQTAYLRRFLSTRRISWANEYVQELPDPLREAVGLPVGHEGAYFVGLSLDELKVDVWQPLVKNQKLRQNKPPQGQPRLWCAWKLEEDGITLRYADKRELYFCYAWLSYLIEHFFTPWDYQLNGEITWQGDDEADHGTIVVRQSHLEHRLLQQTGEKKLIWSDQPIACVHQDALETRLVCIHLANQGTDVDYVLWFSGQGQNFSLVCHECAEKIKRENSSIALCQICWRCYTELETWGCQDGIVGQPEEFVRSTTLSVVKHHQDILLSEPILVMQPVPTRQESVWIALTQGGSFVEINVTTGTTRHLLQLSESITKRTENLALHISSNGYFAALVQAKGVDGVVYNLQTGQLTMQLQRCHPNYAQYSRFPIAFVEQDGRLLLVYDSQQHGLAVFDPHNGELVSNRPIRGCEFSGELTISHDQEWIIDHGWIWQPNGMVVVWNLRRWLQAPDWDKENDPSLMELCQRPGFWDGPLCWIDERTVAVWGYGEDADWIIPAVRLFDVVAEKELGWFAGPEGTLVYDEYLFAMSEKQGLTAWDVATGERVLADPDFHPTHYHRGAKQFLQIDEQQHTFHLGMLVDEHASSS